MSGTALKERLHHIRDIAENFPPNELRGAEELRERMAQFTKTFEAFINNSRQSIEDQDAKFVVTQAEVNERAKKMKSDLERMRMEEIELKDQRKKQVEEVKEWENTIAEMETKKKARDDRVEILQAQVAEMKAAVEKKRALRAAEKQQLMDQQARNKPELEFWEDHLGMKIDGAGIEDHLKITYTHVVDTDWKREFWFVVNMTSADYEVVKCRPKLNKDELTRVVDKLNESRQFSIFLKDMRQLFKSAATAE
ncbi:chromosome segregation protein Spc25-domain-containing protein [Pyronema omphalodes]|nr:chromosome segregation protein Spc25-domain-containing protein [Pyronema omphalodes]